MCTLECSNPDTNGTEKCSFCKVSLFHARTVLWETEGVLVREVSLEKISTQC